MGRLKPIAPDRLTPHQKELVAQRPGGRVRGPWTAWLHTPGLWDSVVPLMDYLRTKTAVPPRLLEIATLVPVRAWTAQFAWALHEQDALKAGLDPAVIEAIRTRKQPPFSKEDEAIVYAMATELVDDKRVSPATYAKALGVLGEEALVTLVTTVGFFAMVAGLLTTFDVDVPEGMKLPLD
jgi:4-carboxymuconolactone decarboxylase